MAARTSPAERNGRASADTAANGARRLVIVESPAKARTIAGYLGKGYVVESSIGHIRDMPGSAADIPDSLRKEPWARLGVNIDADFEPLYVVNADKRQQVSKLKKLLKDADELLLATDEDREGEAIAWHLVQELKPKVPARRMVFHEITPEAIRAAVASPRDDGQRPRGGLPDPPRARPALRLRSLARAVEESHAAAVGRPGPVGRRQARGRQGEGAHRVPARPATGTSRPSSRRSPPARTRPGSRAHLVAPRRAADRAGPRFRADRRTAGRRGQRGQAGAADPASGRGGCGWPGRPAAGAAFAVKTVERKPYRRSPYAPFRTTTLQQEASRKLGFSAKYTMQVAQRLYENGHITYMRTDSVTLSQTALTAARTQARELYGAEYVPDAPRTYVEQGQERAGGARGDQARRRRLPHARPAPGSPATSCGCTSWSGSAPSPPR